MAAQRRIRLGCAMGQGGTGSGGLEIPALRGPYGDLVGTPSNEPHRAAIQIFLLTLLLVGIS